MQRPLPLHPQQAHHATVCRRRCGEVSSWWPQRHPRRREQGLV